MKLKKILKNIKDETFSIISINDHTTFETNIATIHLCFPTLLNKKVTKIYTYNGLLTIEVY